MTQRDVARGYWEWVAVDELKGFEVRDACAVPDGTVDQQIATEPHAAGPSQGDGIERMVIAFEATPNGSRVTTTTYFDSVADLERLLAMGM